MEIRRRTVVQWGIFTLVLSGRGANGDGAAVLAHVKAKVGRKPPPAEKPEPLTRYQFDCVAADGTDIGHFSSLEEVWATSQYMRIARSDVLYVGAGPHTLTVEEIAAVNEARAAGSLEPSRTALCLKIIEACTRMNPQTLQSSLALLGAPVIKGALILAPQAPQAKVLSRWLGIVP